MISVLVVEDDVQFNKIMCSHLSNYGYDVVGCSSGANALAQMEKVSFDVIVSDVMMKEMNGFEFVKQARLIDESIPVLLLTARDDMTSKEQGYKIGIDDYIVKPFSMMEMVSRVKAVLRRSQPQQVSKLLKVGGLVVNLDEHTVVVDGNRVQLTYKEFELLRMFLSHPGMVYTREQLFSQVWKLDYMGDSRTLDSHIRTLRQKLDGYGKMIETVRNVGYRWEVGYDK